MQQGRRHFPLPRTLESREKRLEGSGKPKISRESSLTTSQRAFKSRSAQRPAPNIILRKSLKLGAGPPRHCVNCSPSGRPCRHGKGEIRLLSSQPTTCRLELLPCRQHLFLRYKAHTYLRLYRRDRDRTDSHHIVAQPNEGVVVEDFGEEVGEVLLGVDVLGLDD